jgi:hypothetical protein
MRTSLVSILLASVLGTSFGYQIPLIKNVGVTAPFDNKFDPLKFSEDVSTREFARLREAELKHARWGMISATSIPLLELSSNEPAIHAFDKLSSEYQMGIAGLILAGEFLTMLRGYKNPFVEGSPAAFKLRDDYQPGDMGFHLADKWSDEMFTHYSNKELNNGRLAMIAALGMIVQELVTDSTLF